MKSELHGENIYAINISNYAFIKRESVRFIQRKNCPKEDRRILKHIFNERFTYFAVLPP